MSTSSDSNSTVEIIIHGRGGQGAVTAAQIIAEAAFKSGNFKDVMSFPAFGAERRGAPVQAYTRLSREGKIYTRAQITRPDITIVLDETILNSDILGQLKDGGILLVNTPKTPGELAGEFDLHLKRFTIGTADVLKICIENELLVDDLPIVNTPVLGALAKVFPDIGLDVMKRAIEEHIGPDKGKLNSLAADYTSAITTCVEAGADE
ncbi:MAG: 2-oxoacid:acceptor oxidoreductase family protein [Promethearchaeota archaeon]